MPVTLHRCGHRVDGYGEDRWRRRSAPFLCSGAVIDLFFNNNIIQLDPLSPSSGSQILDTRGRRRWPAKRPIRRLLTLGFHRRSTLRES